MGDGMAAVFASARNAVRAVLAAQQGLAAEDWAEVTGPLAARMGLLTDEGVLGGEHYLNPPLNRCARLMAAGHGGQALVSGATELLVREDLPAGCALVDLGEHRLRDLARPVRIFQLTGPGLRAEFPPPRTQEAFAGNLPVQLSSFVGRAGELAGLAAAMARSPLVTVTGPGGVGKTRLALHAAVGQLSSFRDGAWLCELAPAGDGETMAQAVLAALRARPRTGLSTAGRAAAGRAVLHHRDQGRGRGRRRSRRAQLPGRRGRTFGRDTARGDHHRPEPEPHAPGRMGAGPPPGRPSPGPVRGSHPVRPPPPHPQPGMTRCGRT
jgi:hypothetical protein